MLTLYFILVNPARKPSATPKKRKPSATPKKREQHVCDDEDSIINGLSAVPAGGDISAIVRRIWARKVRQNPHVAATS